MFSKKNHGKDFEIYCNKSEKDFKRAWFADKYTNSKIKTNTFLYECNEGEELTGIVRKLFEKFENNKKMLSILLL
ncbi:MAG: hypothetical protein PHD70_07200 [Anaerostipes sp.]|nr:hypothetical protein [Anaerostipes sp.]